jgi:FAD/FMN-containing dehydrogenase
MTARRAPGPLRRDPLSAAGDRPGARPSPQHAGRREAFVREFRARLAARGGAADKVRLGKRSSNLFRQRRGGAARLDARGLDRVLAVDPARRIADVEGMVPYDALVEATLRHGLLPAVVPELKSITVGGAISGVGIESSSFRHGFVHETVEKAEVLTGDGAVVDCAPDGEHRDLFFGLANSYGTLGYVLRARLRLAPARRFVEVQHVRFEDPRPCFEAMRQIAEEAQRGPGLDFLDGVAFGGRELYLTLGRFTDEAPRASDYTYLRIYHRSIRTRSRDFLTAAGYVWRWDADWFWCSRAFGMENPVLRALAGRRLLTSRFYGKVMRLYRRHRVEERWNRLARLVGNPTAREPVIQDVEIPIEGAADFLGFLLRDVGITPIWLCPVRPTPAAGRFPLYRMDPGRLYVNFGFWGSVPLPDGQRPGDPNRAIERQVAALGGRKSLYSTSFYPEDEFWNAYGGEEYRALRRRYDPDGAFWDLYQKCVLGR